MKWVALTVDNTPNALTYGINLTNDGTSDIGNKVLPITDSESEVDPVIDATSDFPPEGSYLTPEISTSPSRHGQGTAKQHSCDYFLQRDKYNRPRRENMCAKNYQTTQSAQEYVNAFHCRHSRKRDKYKQRMRQ